MHRSISAAVLAAAVVVCLGSAMSGCGGADTPTEAGPTPLTDYEAKYIKDVERDGRALISLENQFCDVCKAQLDSASDAGWKAHERRLNALWKKMVRIARRWQTEPAASPRLEQAHKAWLKVLDDGNDFRETYNDTVQMSKGYLMFTVLWDLPKDLRKDIKRMRRHMAHTRELLKEARREAA